MSQPYRFSLCVYCGSSNDADPSYLALATALGAALAQAGVRLVYGGGGVGLMGACARAARGGGGAVLGVLPRFLLDREPPLDGVETLLVDTMHARKQRMFDESEGFIVLPGGIGTLEEVVETLSWARLNLHSKPIVFLAEDGFWDPFFALLRHMQEARLSPAWTARLYSAATTVAHAIDLATPPPASTAAGEPGAVTLEAPLVASAASAKF